MSSSKQQMKELLDKYEVSDWLTWVNQFEMRRKDERGSLERELLNLRYDLERLCVNQDVRDWLLRLIDTLIESGDEQKD